METKEKLELLKTWEEMHKEIEKTVDTFETAIGCDICESSIYNTLWKIFEKYTELLSKLISGDKDPKDVAGWLDWYSYENYMGKSGREAKAHTWKKMRKIDILKMLLKVIEE
jgi:hypothetical protein